MGKFSQITKAARDAFKAFSDQSESLNHSLERLKREREELLTAPLPLEDHLARFDASIDAQAAELAESLRVRLQVYEKDPFRELGVGSNVFAYGDSAQSIDRLLCGLLGPQIKENFRTLCKQHWDWPTPGTPREQRRKDLAKIDQEIADVEQQLKELAAEADAVGLKLRGPRG